MYFEGSLAARWTSQQKKDDSEVTHAEMIAYYRDHISDYETQGTARWEQLTARFDKFDTKAEAYQALATWGNQVWSGRPFAEVAKANSQEVPPARAESTTGPPRGAWFRQFWTTPCLQCRWDKSARSSRTTAPFHIVRVLERKETSRTPFIETQKEIKAGNQKAAQRESVEGVYRQAPPRPPSGRSSTAPRPIKSHRPAQNRASSSTNRGTG